MNIEKRAKMKQVLGLMRMHSWWVCILLAYPFLWSVFLFFDPIPWGVVLGGCVGCVGMRTVGCVWSDVCDRGVDAQVKRTKSRPLAAGTLSVWWACLIIGVVGVLGLTGLVLWGNFASLVFVGALVAGTAIYPLGKRFTCLAQVLLGLVINLGVFFPFLFFPCKNWWPVVFLYLGGVFWTIVYDTVYGCQDVLDDRRIGVKGLHIVVMKMQRPRLFLSGICCIVMFCVWGALCCLWGGFSAIYACVPMSVLLASMLVRLRCEDSASAKKFFSQSLVFGAFFLAILCCKKTTLGASLYFDAGTLS